jgi:hypothetical protein
LPAVNRLPTWPTMRRDAIAPSDRVKQTLMEPNSEPTKQSSTADVIAAAEKATGALHAAQRVREIIESGETSVLHILLLLQEEAVKAEESFKAHQKSRG